MGDLTLTGEVQVSAEWMSSKPKWDARRTLIFSFKSVVPERHSENGDRVIDKVRRELQLRREAQCSDLEGFEIRHSVGGHRCL